VAIAAGVLDGDPEENVAAGGTREFIDAAKYAQDAKSQALQYFKNIAQNAEQGQHGTPYAQAGNWLIQQANILEKQEALPEIVSDLRAQGQRLLNYARGVSHK